MAHNTLDSLVVGLARALSLLSSALGSTRDAETFLNLLGWDLPPGVKDIGLTGINLQSVSDKLLEVENSTPEERKDNQLMAKRYAELLAAVAELVQNLLSTMKTLSTLPALSTPLPESGNH